MKLPTPITFEWDENNKDKNWKKHKVQHKEIEEVFFNRPIKFFADAKHSTVEKRYLALGKTNDDCLLSMVFTIRSNKVRVISAHKQSRKEKTIYEK